MRRMIGLLALSSAFALSAAAISAPPPPAREASIPFADHGGIENWYAVDRETLYIQAQNRQWDRAELMTPCIDLAHADRPGVKSNPDGSSDQLSAILLHGQRCPLKSLTRSGPPPHWGTHDKK